MPEPVQAASPVPTTAFATVAVESSIKPANKKQEIAEDLCRQIAGQRPLPDAYDGNGTTRLGTYMDDKIAGRPYQSLPGNTVTAEKKQYTVRTGVLNTQLFGSTYDVFTCKAPSGLVGQSGPQDRTLDVPHMIIGDPTSLFPHSPSVENIMIDKATGKAVQFFPHVHQPKKHK